MGLIPCLKYVYTSAHECMFISLLMSAPSFLHSCAQMCSPMWPHLHVSVTILLVPFFGWNVNRHEHMYVCPPDSLCLLYTFCIVISGNVHSCVAPHACPNHPSPGSILWFECVLGGSLGHQAGLIHEAC